MPVRFGKILIVFALVVSIGAHWALLQSVAWVGMMASYSENSTFKDALVKTFDGKHPCCLCKAIAAAKRSEKKSDFSTQIQKLEFLPVEEEFVLIAPSRFPRLAQVNSFTDSLTQKPPTPAPRLV